MYITCNNDNTLKKGKLYPINQIERKITSEIIQYIDESLKINREN